MPSAHGSRLSDPDQELLEPAWQMRWRVPELALMFSDRAVAQAWRTGDAALRIRAEALALFASNRLGRSVAVTERAIAAVRDAEQSSGAGIASEMRVELACCARRAGSHDVAVRVLQPVLGQDRVRPDLRAHALIELAGSLPSNRRAGESAEALDEAERLYTSEAELSRDTARLLRARVNTARACHHRRHGELSDAAGAAAEGLSLLERLGDATTDSGEVRSTLILEQVHALLDMGQHGEAIRVAEPLLAQPLRAASAAPMGWLRLALATRVRMPEGEHRTAVGLLTEALSGAERHELVDLQAELNNTLSHLHDQADNLAEALRCLRAGYAADRSWRASVYNARIRLVEEFPVGSASPPAPHVPLQQSKQPSPQPVDPASSSDGEDARYAARRLMDSLTGRGSADAEPATASEQEPVQDGSRRRRSGGRRAAAEHGSSATGRATGRRHRADGASAGAADAVLERTKQAAEADESTDWYVVTGHDVAAGPGAEATTEPRGAEGPVVATHDSWGQHGVGAGSQTWPDRFTDEAEGAGVADSRSSEPDDAVWPVADVAEQPAGPASPAPDVTTIMPVIPGLAAERGESPSQEGPSTGKDVARHAEAAPTGWEYPGVGEASDQEPPGLDTPTRFDAASPVGDDAGGGEVLGGDTLYGQHVDGRSFDGDPLAGDWPGDGRSEVPEERPSRRANGRSLAEIRAALSGGEDRGATSERATAPRHDPDSPEPGGRRARHAEPYESEQDPAGTPGTGPETAAEFLARHRALLQDLPGIQIDVGSRDRDPSAGGDSEDALSDSAERLAEESQDGAADVSAEDQPAGDVPDESGPGRDDEVDAGPAPGGDVGLADLLAEALVAYRSGQTASQGSGETEPEAPPRPRHAGARSVADGGRSQAANEHFAGSSEDSSPRVVRARHRHAADSTPDSRHVWTPPVY